MNTAVEEDSNESVEVPPLESTTPSAADDIPAMDTQPIFVVSQPTQENEPEVTPKTAVVVFGPIVSTNLPSKLIRVAVTDELERLRITAAVSAFVEDFVEGDSLKSKQLGKLTTSYAQTMKIALLPSLSSIVEELLKVSIVTSGKQAGSLAANVKQGVCALLPEHVKNAKKQIQTIFARINAIADEAKRNKIAYARLVDKQQRSIKEADQIIQSFSVGEDLSAANNGNGRKAMLTKLVAEKKSFERYRALVRDLDALEVQMQSDCRRINVGRSELLIEISKAFKELEELEIERLQVMRESIDRLLLSFDVAIKTHMDAFAPFEEQLGKLDLRAEIEFFLSKTVSSEAITLPAAFQQYELDPEKSSYTTSLQQVSVKADRMEEILDYFKALSQRLSQCVQDAGSAETSLVKTCSRAVEKHGFSRLPCDGSLFEDGRILSETALLLRDELPTTRSQWESAVQIIGHILEAHSRTTDFYADETSQQFEIILSRISVCKKTLVDKSDDVLRNMESTLQRLGKVRAKLSRTRQQIREKKQFVRTLRGTPDHGAPPTELSAAELDPSHELLEPVSPASSGDAGSAVSTAGGGAGANNATSMSSFASAAVLSRRAMESFNSTLRATANLKQVVGLESTADRVARVEVQIAQLEEEERQDVEHEKHAMLSFEALLNVVHQELEDVVSITVEIFLADVNTLKSALNKYLNWHKEKFIPVTALSKELREKINASANEVKDDYRVVYERLLMRTSFFDAELFEIPATESFEPHKLLRVTDDGEVETVTAEFAADDVSAMDEEESRQRGLSGEELGSPTRPIPSAEFELKKFGLSSTDRVLESYSCALYPKKGLLTHGRMFVTQHFIAFSGWPDTRVLLRISSLEKVEKMNTLMYIPNAVSLLTAEKEEFFFGSFIDRDQCFTLVNRLLEVEKHIIEVNGVNEAVVSRKLEYGYQQVKPVPPPIKAAPAAKDSDKSVSPTTSSTSTEENAAAADSEKKPSDSVAEVQAAEEELNIFKEIPINFTNTFNAMNLIEMTNTRLNVTAKQVLKHCWLNVDDYESYLTNSGDFDVKKEEWKPTPSPSIPEDLAKLNFHFGRDMFFQHPRTTMLMFGPKNAPTQQRQYIYVPFQATTDGSFTMENIAKSKIDKFVVLIITQFDGVPMADVFRVLLYQFYENVDGKCHVRYGLGMHYVKSTMFKGQIVSGTKEELVTQLAALIDHIKKTTAAAITAAGGKAPAAIAEAAPAGEAAAVSGEVPVGVVHRPAEPAQDLMQQLLNAVMGNWALAALIAVLVLLFISHVWYTRSQMSFLTRKVQELESVQTKLLLDILENRCGLSSNHK